MPQQDGSGHRIVAGVDGSPSSVEALRWAVRQAELTGATVDAVMAWQPPAATGLAWGVSLTDDTNVPVSQAIYFHRALSWFGVEHELVIYPREGHAFAERNHQLDLLCRTRAWFGRWLHDGASDGRGLPA